MLTAAGREKEQLLMSFQYKEPTLSLAFYLSILLYLYVHLLLLLIVYLNFIKKQNGSLLFLDIKTFCL